jgi:urease accessory protein
MLPPHAPEAQPAEATPLARPQATAGRLELLFHAAAGQPTRLRSLVQQPPLRVVRTCPLPEGGALAHLHNVSGGVLGGDQLRLGVTLEPQTRVQLTTTGATRIYRHRPALPVASQQSRFQVGAGALLELLPDALIPYRSARYQQSTHYRLDDDAGLMAWETVSPGREAHGELFAYDELALRTEIWAGDTPLALEQILLKPATGSPVSPARLGRYRYFTTFYACRVGQPPALWSELEGQMSDLAQRLSAAGEMIWGASSLPAHGVVVRGLSLNHRMLAAALPLFWGLARRRLYGTAAIPPRKVY